MSIVTGFSFGAKKAEILQPALRFLGSVVGREGEDATEEHVKAIIEFGEISDASGLRRSFGLVNWVRRHFPVEFVACMKRCTNICINTCML